MAVQESKGIHGQDRLQLENLLPIDINLKFLIQVLRKKTKIERLWENIFPTLFQGLNSI